MRVSLRIIERALVFFLLVLEFRYVHLDLRLLGRVSLGDIRPTGGVADRLNFICKNIG